MQGAIQETYLLRLSEIENASHLLFNTKYFNILH